MVVTSSFFMYTFFQSISSTQFPCCTCFFLYHGLLSLKRLHLNKSTYRMWYLGLLLSVRIFCLLFCSSWLICLYFQPIFCSSPSHIFSLFCKEKKFLKPLKTSPTSLVNYHHLRLNESWKEILISWEHSPREICYPINQSHPYSVVWRT